MNKWIAGARPRTLPAAVVPVAIGTACAVVATSEVTGTWDGAIIWWRALAALVVSLALQVATNYANDYSDGVRGTDDDRRAGPARLVGSGLAAPGAVKRAAFIAFGVAGITGAALAFAVGPELFIVGAASMLAGWFYTGGSRPYGYSGWGEVFVFVFFGLVATVGSTYVQLERVTALSVWSGVAAGALACALLVTNNLRDIPGDVQVDKRTLAVRLGDHRTRWLYGALIVAAFAVAAGVAIIYPLVWATQLAWFAAFPALRSVQAGARGPELVAVLVQTGRVQLLFGALYSIGLWLS